VYIFKILCHSHGVPLTLTPVNEEVNCSKAEILHVIIMYIENRIAKHIEQMLNSA